MPSSKMLPKPYAEPGQTPEEQKAGFAKKLSLARKESHAQRKARILRKEAGKRIKLQEELCVHIAAGLSLPKACAEPGMPKYTTAMLWFHNDEGFAAMVKQAQLERADALFEEALEIADDGRNDWMTRKDPDNPGYLFNGEHIQRSKLRVDTRKWAAAKLNPKYNDKVELAGDPDKPVVVQVMHKVVNIVRQETLEEPEKVINGDWEDTDA